MRLNGASLAFAACLVLLGTGSAIADDESGNNNASLKGTYRIFSNVSTVGSTAHLYFIGVITYDRNGHARMADGLPARERRCRSPRRFLCESAAPKASWPTDRAGMGAVSTCPVVHRND